MEVHESGGFRQGKGRHGRRKESNRLWYFEKRLVAGVRWQVRDRCHLDFSGGYAFDRFFFEGERYEDRSFNRLDVSGGVFLGVQIVWRF